MTVKLCDVWPALNVFLTPPDAYINDPLTHIFVEPVEPKESEEENFFTSPLMLVVYGLIVLVLAGLGFMMTRRPKELEMNQFAQVPAQQPMMQQQVTMPVAQANPYQQPAATQSMRRLLHHRLWFNQILLWITTMDCSHKDTRLNKPQCIRNNISHNSTTRWLIPLA